MTVEFEPQRLGLDRDEILGFLLRSGIDSGATDENEIYVTGLAFNFWLRLDVEDTAIAFTTNWDLVDGVANEAAVDFVNELNSSLAAVQFSYSTERKALVGHMWLSCSTGVDPTQLTRTAIRFASIFHRGVVVGIEQGVVSESARARATPN